MALIECPECGGKISDKAPACIHCGFPLELLEASYNDKEEDISNNDIETIQEKYCIELVDVKDYRIKAITVLKTFCGYSLSDAKDIVDSLPADIFYTDDLNSLKAISQELQNAGIQYNLYKDNQPYELMLKAQINKKIKEKQFCPYCGKAIDLSSSFCPYCGKRIEPIQKDSKQLTNVIKGNHPPLNVSENKGSIEEMQRKAELQNVLMQRAQLMQQQQQLEAQRRQMEAQQKQYDSQAKCPMCGSTSLSGNKQGFGIGKAAVGAVMFGGIGLLAGGINANKTVVTCMNCGHKFKL